jgi:hypothetical protein
MVDVSRANRFASEVRAVALIAFLLLLPKGVLAQAAPFTSFRRLVTSNGFAPAVIDLEARRLTIFRENLYRYPAPGVETRNLAFDLYLGLRASGQSAWLTSSRIDEAGYERGTNLIRTVQRRGSLRVTTTYFAPMDLAARALVVVAEIRNEGPDLSDVALFSIHNFHLGGGADRTEGEQIRWDPSARGYVESSAAPGAAAGALLIQPFTPATHHTASPENPFPLVEASQLFTDLDDSGVRNDAVSGFELDVRNRGTFPAGAVEHFAFAVAYAPDRDVASLAALLDAYRAGRAPDQILADERAAWRRWHLEGVWPVTMSADETEIAEQSLALLRTGQVRESGAPNGQIVASLPPGMWDIAWLRDGLFAVDAFTMTGHHAEAEAALDFYIRGPFGDYQSYIGRPYGLSVARYYGNAREESDSNADGPNVELDGFGMYLASAAKHAAFAPEWLRRVRSHLDPLVADVLVTARDAQTGLVTADSSIWESHWENGGRQRWVFTSGQAAIGLSAYADALDAHGQVPNDPRPEAYRARSREIAAAMRASLVDPQTGAFAASVEQLARGSSFADAQAALILHDTTAAPSSPIGLATLDLLRDSLFLSSTTRRGYKRNDDGGAYDEREWIVIDLGLSRALRAAGRTQDADALLTWITGQARANFSIVPELFDQTDARYQGEAPMIGFGAGAYLLTLIDRSGTRPVDGAPTPDAGLTDAGFVDGGVIEDARVSDDAAASRDATSPSPDAMERTDGGQTPPGRSDASSARVETTACGCRSTSGQGSIASYVAALLLAIRLGRRSTCPRERMKGHRARR